MSAITPISALDQFLDGIVDCLTPEVARRIIDLRLDAQTQSWVDELAEKSSAGTLTATERQEYRAYVEGMDLVGIFKAKTRRVLNWRASQLLPSLAGGISDPTFVRHPQGDYEEPETLP